MKTILCTGLMLLLCVGGIMAQEEGLVIARKAFAAQDWQTAADYYKQSIIPGDIPAQDYFNWGLSLENLKEYREAMKPFKYTLNHTKEGEQLNNRAKVHIALCFGWLGNESLTLDWLARVEKAGVKAYGFFSGAPAFEFLKDHPEFQAFLEKQKPCTGPEYQQFDFWIGDWQVFDPAGQQVGTNKISPVAEGCGLREEWTSANGTDGTSINFYDAQSKKWHQTWIGGDGGALYLDGGLADNAMVLSDGKNRITWTPKADGSVRQLWEVSSDEGKTWSVAFDGLYKKQNK